MPPTIASLVQNGAFGIKVRTGRDLLDRPIHWVHVSELPDPTPYLEGGELLLTLGLQIAGDREGWPGYVERLAKCGVSALGMSTGFAFQSIPPTLLESSERCGLPILEVPRPIPFMAIAKSVFADIVAEENDTAAAVFASQQRLARASLEAASDVSVLAQLGRELSGWAVLADVDGSTIHATAAMPPAVAAEVAETLRRLRRRGLHASASFAVGDASVVAQALGARTTVRGFLAVGVDRPVRAADHSIINVAASLLTLILEQSRTQDDERRRLAAVVYDLLRTYGNDAATPLARELGWERPAGPIRVAVVNGPPRELSDVAAVLRRASDRLLVGESNEIAEPHLAILAPADDEVLDALKAAVDDRPACAVGVSRSTASDEVRAAEQQAVSALRRGTDGGGRITVFDDLTREGVFAMLGPSSVEVAAGLLAPLIRHDERQGGALVETVRTWLAHHGQWQPAADALGIHRHTLRYRVRTAERLLGRSFDSARTRMETLLALEVFEHSGGGPS